MADRWATFDCYGTLIDWNGGIRGQLARVFGEGEADGLLERYHELEPQIEHEQPTLPYREVLTEAMRPPRAPPERGGRARAVAARLARRSPRCGRRSSEARERGWRLAILSNTDRDYIEASIGRIGVPFDVVIVAGEIGSYKPAEGHWRAFEREVGPASGRARGREPLPRHRDGERARPADRLDQPPRRAAATRRRRASCPTCRACRRLSMSSSPPDGFTARGAALEDADAVADLILAAEPVEPITGAEVRDWWRGQELERDARLVHASDGRLAAFGRRLERADAASVEGYVHPELRRPGSRRLHRRLGRGARPRARLREGQERRPLHGRGGTGAPDEPRLRGPCATTT